MKTYFLSFSYEKLYYMKLTLQFPQNMIRSILFRQTYHIREGSENCLAKQVNVKTNICTEERDRAELASQLCLLTKPVLTTLNTPPTRGLCDHHHSLGHFSTTVQLAISTIRINPVNFCQISFLCTFYLARAEQKSPPRSQ